VRERLESAVQRVRAAIGLGRRGREPAPALPSGADEVRRLEGDAADRLAELAALLAAVEQAVVALTTLAERRRSDPSGRSAAEAVTDLALLRFGVVQFCACFGGRRGSARLTARQAFGARGVGFFDHLRTLGQELEGAHPRITGRTETVALLRGHGDSLVPLSVVTRMRRPDRLTLAELGHLIEFMARGIDAYAERANQLRGELGERMRALSPEELERLPRADM
jgi:hypothetical protein